MFDIYYLMGSILSTIKFPLEDVGSDVYISLENGGYFECDNQFYNNQTCNMCSALQMEKNVCFVGKYFLPR